MNLFEDVAIYIYQCRNDREVSDIQHFIAFLAETGKVPIYTDISESYVLLSDLLKFRNSKLENHNKNQNDYIKRPIVFNLYTILTKINLVRDTRVVLKGGQISPMSLAGYYGLHTPDDIRFFISDRKNFYRYVLGVSNIECEIISNSWTIMPFESNLHFTNYLSKNLIRNRI